MHCPACKGGKHAMPCSAKVSTGEACGQLWRLGGRGAGLGIDLRWIACEPGDFMWSWWVQAPETTKNPFPEARHVGLNSNVEFLLAWIIFDQHWNQHHQFAEANIERQDQGAADSLKERTSLFVLFALVFFFGIANSRVCKILVWPFDCQISQIVHLAGSRVILSLSERMKFRVCSVLMVDTARRDAQRTYHRIRTTGLQALEFTVILHP